MVVQGTGNLVKSLSLLEQAREDVYFSKIDRELIEALHREAEKAAQQTGRDSDLVAFVDLSDTE